MGWALTLTDAGRVPQAFASLRFGLIGAIPQLGIADALWSTRTIWNTSLASLPLLTVLSAQAVLFSALVIGRENLGDYGVTFAAATVFAALRVGVLWAWVSVRISDVAGLRSIAWGSVVYLVVVTVLAMAGLAGSIQYREVLSLPGFQLAPATAVINVAIVGCSLLIVERDSRWQTAVLLVVVCTLAWANRTGLVMGGFLLFVGAIRHGLSAGRAVKIGLAFVLVLPLLQVSPLGARFASEGLQSLRWVSQLDAVLSVFLGQYPDGGYQNVLGDTIWVHNFFLDVYRIAGIPHLVVTFALALWCLVWGARGDSWARVHWGVCFAVAATSVPLEGQLAEVFFVLGGIYVYPLLRRITPRA